MLGEKDPRTDKSRQCEQNVLEVSVEDCRGLEALTQFGLAFSFQMLMFIRHLLCTKATLKERGRRLSHPPGSQRQRVAVNWVAPRGRAQAVGGSYSKRNSVHVQMEGAAPLGVSAPSWGCGGYASTRLASLWEHIRRILNQVNINQSLTALSSCHSV